MLRRTSEISFTTQSSQTHHHAHNQLVYSQSDFLSRNSDFRNTRTHMYTTRPIQHEPLPARVGTLLSAIYSLVSTSRYVCAVRVCRVRGDVNHWM